MVKNNSPLNNFYHISAYTSIIFMNFNYPSTLPVSHHRAEILKALRHHQVVVVAGDTGSGKTTQIPKMCLELDPDRELRIGCTQPRRIAAITVADRVAEELGEHSAVVGYKIRFQDKTNVNTRIKFMTDGVLLAETRTDRNLENYDIVMIDEAHERGLNIDFLLGHIKNILPRRPELKVIITSATIDTQAFSSHFNNAPIINIPGKTYPIELRYAPPQEDDYGEQESFIENSVRVVSRILSSEPPGDILVFLPAERDIRNCCEILQKKTSGSTVLPLYGRLHAADQKKIFQPCKNTKIVVATNVAETSITVPGIRYVVDSGLARMAFYNFKAKTTSLPIQKISQASCNQRKGRCGRVAPGVCYRLYDEEDFLQRDEYTIPEIKRSNLAEVILQMRMFKLGDPYRFPFIDPPHTTAIKEGYRQLDELGAINANKGLTKIGKIMASMPIDPCISRIIIEANGNKCLREIVVIATVLAIQDPRVRPTDYEKQADEAHEQFIHPQSDFLSFLKIWNLFHNVKAKTSWSRLKKFCKGHFLSFQRMREWIDLHDQMVRILQGHSQFVFSNEEASYEAIHKSLAIGFLRNIATKKSNALYTGSSAKELMIFPGSSQFHKKPQWLVAASFLETNRLYALHVAAIEPEWLEPLGKKLCTYSWSEPRYHRKTGCVMANEQVSLFGLVIVRSRKVNFGKTTRKNQQEARMIFLQTALVEGRLAGNVPFLKHNQKLLEKWEAVEDRLRAKNIVANEDAIFRFYEERLPDFVYDRPTLTKFLKTKSDGSFLQLKESDIIQRHPEDRELADFPSQLNVGTHAFALSYLFDPAKEEDGVTVRIPLELVETLHPEIFEWVVPGLLEEKTTTLLKGLPKRIRKHLVPINTTVDRILDDIQLYKGSYYRAMEASIFKHFKISISKKDWPQDIAEHLKMRFVLFDISGKEVACGRDFSQLTRTTLNQPALTTKKAGGRERKILQQWEAVETKEWAFADLPEKLPLYARNNEIAGYLYAVITPVPEKGAVTVRFVGKETEAHEANRRGLRYFYRLHYPQQYMSLKKMCSTTLTGPSSLWLVHIFTTRADAVASLLDFTMDTLFATTNGCIPQKTDHEKRLEAVPKSDFFAKGKSICDTVMSLLRVRRETANTIEHHKKLAKRHKTYDAERYEEYTALLNEILLPDFLESMEFDDLQNRERYMKSLMIRVERAHADFSKDLKKAQPLKPHMYNLQSIYKHKKELSPLCCEKIKTYEQMLQEFRISLFSPEMKTRIAVSEKKLRLIWQEIQREC